MPARAGGDSALALYLEGWLAADTARLLAATAGDYRLHDPLLGTFSRRQLAHYFAAVAARFVVTGPVRGHDLAFRLHGPVANAPGAERLVFWREAPGLGLSGMTTLTAGHSGISGETIVYDANMATELLRGPGPLTGGSHGR